MRNNLLKTSITTFTSLASATGSATIITANDSRRGLTISNTDANPLYIKFGATASATSMTAIVPTFTTWTMTDPIYTGVIDGIWTVNGSGAANATEMT